MLPFTDDAQAVISIPRIELRCLFDTESVHRHTSGCTISSVECDGCVVLSGISRRWDVTVSKHLKRYVLQPQVCWSFYGKKAFFWIWLSTSANVHGENYIFENGKQRRPCSFQTQMHLLAELNSTKHKRKCATTEGKMHRMHSRLWPMMILQRNALVYHRFDKKHAHEPYGTLNDDGLSNVWTGSIITHSVHKSLLLSSGNIQVDRG